jgi:formylglycine-generating enzyme
MLRFAFIHASMVLARRFAIPALSFLFGASGCAPAPSGDKASPAASSSSTSEARPKPAPSASAAVPAKAADAGAAASASAPKDDPMALHLESKDDLLALFKLRKKKNDDGALFLEKNFGVGTPSRTNQGNKELAHHAIGRAKCLEGLAKTTLQTPEQRETCGGFENMVPIYRRGKPKSAKACIDIFEFPNKACELPMVWIAPTQASRLCELQGKRLCQQEEWMLACKGDPDGGKDQTFAYGDELDLEVCNTNKKAAKFSPDCEPDSARSAWNTCSTNTEPSGAFPRCRSRFGVFDQHGNVAEIMTRVDVEDGKRYSQLKGSAFFYVDVARKPKERQEKGRETYPDHCGHDPRWHVEPMESAWHVNYHLGFRCCRTVR